MWNVFTKEKKKIPQDFKIYFYLYILKITTIVVILFTDLPFLIAVYYKHFFIICQYFYSLHCVWSHKYIVVYFKALANTLAAISLEEIPRRETHGATVFWYIGDPDNNNPGGHFTKQLLHFFLFTCKHRSDIIILFLNFRLPCTSKPS